MQFGSHVDRPVRLEDRDGRGVVVKTYLRGGSRHVYDDMLALWRSPFGRVRRPPGMPEPLSVDPATGEVVMARIRGRALGGRGDLGDSVRRLPEVAALLADLHSSGVTVRRVRSADRVLASSRRKVADLGARGADRADRADVADGGDGAYGGDGAGPRAEIGAVAVAAAAQTVLELLSGCCPADEDLVPSHGDFSPRNVLGDVNGVALIDMDRMQMADPAHDLAYWGAWTWATEAMNHQVPSWEGLSHLQSHYHARLGSGVASENGKLAFHQAVALLRIVHGWSTLQGLPTVQRDLLGEAARLLGGRL